ncbi:MAG: sugar phosphate nucleotidyltransferase [Anaerolineae bacterium]|jgi:NDP-sugar pyrophosphorylase family protein
MLAVVLAAGRGKRLLPLTNDRSKAMLPIAGRPIVGRVLAMLARGGAGRFVVVVHPEDQALIDHLRRPPWADRVRLAYQSRRLGMAHAIECAFPPMRERSAPPFLLASCDNLYPDGHVARLITRLQEGLDAAITLMWAPRPRATQSALVVLRDGFVVDIIEKPQPDEIPSYGGSQEALCAPALYALSPRILSYLPEVSPSSRGEREFTDALRLLIRDGGRVGGQVVKNRMTLTRPEDLLAINRHLLRTNPDCATVAAELPPDAAAIPPVRIEAGAIVCSRCHIGPEAYLESGCRVGPGAIIRRAIIMRGASVLSHRVVEDSVLV